LGKEEDNIYKKGNTMNGKERTLRALNFEETDRLPVVGGFVRHPTFLADTAGVSIKHFWNNPRETAIRAFRKLKVDVIIGLILPDRKTEVGAQVGHNKGSRFESPEDILEDIAELPGIDELHDNFDFHKHYHDYLKRYQDGEKAIGRDILWLPNTFDSVAQFQNESYFGTENYYMALALYPEEMDKFFRISGEKAFLRNTAVARAITDNDLPRVMWLGQDSCDSRGPYIAPETMNEIYIRHVKRSLQPLKDIGVKILWHADGNIMPIVPYLLDAGVDGFQGLQEKIDTKVDIKSIRKMKTDDDNTPVIVGSISSVTTMPFGSVEDVEREIERCRKLAQADGGGWLLNFSSSLGPEIPEENIKTFYSE